MKRILRIGMDVHSTNYTLCALEPVLGADDIVYANVTVSPDVDNIIQFIDNLKAKIKDDCDILCGYEAGCLGFSLYHELTKKGIRCVILAPTTMLTQQGKRIKTDKRDALMIAQCLAYGGYHAVHIPTDKDDDVKVYLRMRDDHKSDLKKVKQRINAFCLSQGYLGLAPGEDSSAEHVNRLGITKAGNSHLRRLMIEAAKGISKGTVGHKSKDLKARQNGNTAEVIAYADKANERLRRKYYKMIRHGKKKNVAVTAVLGSLPALYGV